MTTAVSPAPAKQSLVLEYALLVLLATMWGSGFSLIKIAIGSIPPITTICLRTGLAGLTLYTLMRLKGLRLPTDTASWKSFATVSTVNTVMPFLLIAYGLLYVDAGLGIILNSTTPIFTFLITWGVTRHETITGRKLAGVLIGIAGILMIVGTEALNGVGKQLVPQLAIVLASLSYAMSAIYGRSFREMNPLVPAAGSLMFGAAVLAPFALVIEQPWTIVPTGKSVLALVVLSLLSTALGNVLYFRLLATLGSLSATSQSYLRVPMGVIVGILLLGETPTTAGLIGLVCVMAGVAAMTITAELPPAGPIVAHMREELARTWRAMAPLKYEYALLLLVSAVWAGSYVWVKVGLETVPPLTLMAGRICTAGLFLLAVMRLSGKRLPQDEATWRMMAAQGLIATVVPFTMIAWGQQYVDAGPAAILSSLSPVFVYLITWGITRHEPTTSMKLAGVVAGLLGVAVVIGPSRLTGIGGTLLPQMAIVLSSLSYAVGVIYARNFRGADAVVTAAGSMLCASAVMLPASIIFEHPWTVRPAWSAILAVIALGVVSTGLGYVLYFRLSRTLGPMGVSSQSYLRAPIGVAMGAALLGEGVSASMLGGLLLVVIGVAAMTVPAQARSARGR